MQNNTNDNLNWLTKVICFMTLTDPTVLKECPQLDRLTVYYTFFSLILQFALAAGLMSYALTIVIPEQYTALIYALALLIAAIIYVFEVRMISSDWTLSGILRSRKTPFSASQTGRLTVRLVLSLIFAIGLYSVPIELKLQEGPINNWLLDKQRISNQPIFATLNKQVNELLTEIQSAQENVNCLKADRQALIQQRKELSQEISAKEQQVNNRAYEAEAQEHGFGNRKEGKRKLYREAKFLEDQYKKEKSKMEDDSNTLTKQITKLDEQIKIADGIVESKRSGLTKFRDKIDEKAQKKVGYIPFHDDLLARYIALSELSEDPKVGQAVNEFGWVIRAVLVSIELLPLLLKVFFSPASIYHVKLSQRTMLIAAQVRYNMETELLKMRGIKQPDRNLVMLSDDSRTREPGE